MKTIITNPKHTDRTMRRLATSAHAFMNAQDQYPSSAKLSNDHLCLRQQTELQGSYRP
jgi:hypothetical protein